MFYDRGNRPGFHIFIISARSRNVKYILTENVPVKRFALSPGLFVIRACAARLHPKGTSSRFALRAPRRFAPRNDTLGAVSTLTIACSDRQRCAGRGMPLPYSGAHHLTTAGTGCKCLPEIAPQGHFLALRAQGATLACGLLAMTNLRTSRHRMCAAKIASLHGAR